MTDVEFYILEGRRDLTATGIMVNAFVELNESVFDELVRLSGMTEALEATKKQRMMSAQFPIKEAKKAMPIQGNGPDALLMVYGFCSSIVSTPDSVTLELKERGAVGTTRNCVFNRSSPELCMSISHYISNAIAELINPEYECMWTHHETCGDPFCRYVFKRKSDPVSVLEDPGRTVMVFPTLPIPKEQWQVAQMWALSAFLWGTVEAFKDLHGSESTVEVITATARKLGNLMGQRLAKDNPKLMDDPSSMAKLIHDIQDSFGQRSSYAVLPNGDFSNEITDCSQQQWSPELCKMYEALFNGIVDGINPAYELVYDKMILLGDQVCHWAIRNRIHDR